MKKTTFLFIAMLMATISASAATGWFNDFLTLKVNGVETPNNYYIGDNPGSGTAFQGAAFGTVSGLELSNIDMKYWSDSQDRTGGALYYKIMSADGNTQIVASTEIIWAHASIGGNDYQGTKPVEVTSNINFLTGLAHGATYQIHIWAKSWGTGQGDSWLSNNGANYVATFTVANPASMGGVYKVGTSTSANFLSLSAAINALNAATITSDLIFEITSDITEAANFGLGKDMGSYKLTIRPDSDADRTITFTQATGNIGPYGHFVIGCATANINTANSDATIQATNNVTIDGYAVAGTTRRLKLTTANSSLTGSSIITIIGGCTNPIIKNLILENKSTGSTPRCIYLTAFKGTSKDESPTNVLIENNYITSMGSPTGQCITGTQSGTTTVRMANLDIKNNFIKAQGRCMEIHYFGAGLDIIGNEIKLSQLGSSGTTNYALWIRTGVGPVNIIGNKFTEISTAEAGTSGTLGTRAISCGSIEHNIYNNTFSGMNRSGAATVNVAQSYIFVVGTGRIYHNTFYMPALTASSTPGVYQAINNGTVQTIEIKNNIFISNEDVKSQFISNVNNVSENNVYYLRVGNTNAKIVSTFSTLSSYQSANPTKDIESKYANVIFTDAANGDLTIAGLSVQDANLKVPSLTAVTTDILGTTRNTSFTYAGAHESTLPFPTTGLDKALMQAGVQISKNGIFIPANGTSSIELYTLNGTLIDKTITNSSYSRLLNNGAYIVKINGKAVKFVK